MKRLIDLARCHVEKAAPELAIEKYSQGEVRDDTEVITTAFESAPQVVIVLLRGCGGLARSQHDSIFGDIIANKALAWAIE